SSLLLSLAALVALAAPAPARQDSPGAPTIPAAPVPTTLPRWSKEILDLAATIPLQDEGRVKPLGTYADFKLLELNGKRTVTWSKERDGKTEKFQRSSMEWLLDSLFFPELAESYPAFLLDTYEVADAIGVPRADHAKRDRWSYAELVPGGNALIDKANRLER